MSVASDRDYFHTLEALRGVGAVAIVLYHLHDRLGYPFVFDNFYLGVDLFFVLSGFIIFHTYGGAIDGGATYSRFLWLRFARLYPLHLLTLLAFVAFQAWAMADARSAPPSYAPLFQHNDAASLAANLLLAQALHLFAGPSFNIPSWSISTEFYTYVLFGGLFWSGLIRPGRSLLVPGLLAIAAYVVLAAVSSSIHVMHDWGLVRNVLGFALGIVAYHIHRVMPTPSTRFLTGMQIGAVAALLLVLATPGRRVPYADFAAPVLFAVLIVSCSYDRGGFCPVLATRPLQWLGRVSYSLYLTHYMLVLVIAELFMDAARQGRIVRATWMTWGLIPVVLVLAFAVAHVTYAYWELPTRLFLRGLWPKPRAVAQKAGS